MFIIAIFIFVSIVLIVGGVLCYALCRTSSQTNKEYEDEYKTNYENIGL